MHGNKELNLMKNKPLWGNMVVMFISVAPHAHLRYFRIAITAFFDVFCCWASYSDAVQHTVRGCRAVQHQGRHAQANGQITSHASTDRNALNTTDQGRHTLKTTAWLQLLKTRNSIFQNAH
eukprot:1152565-Pelagomonas_calceolata.AAC.11